MAQTVRGAFSYSIPNYRKQEEEKKKQAYADSNALAQRKADADAQAKAANDAYWADQYAKSQPKVATAKGAINAAAGAAMINRPNETQLKDLGGGGNGDGGVGSYARAYANFVPSQTYLKAMEYTQTLLDQLSSGRTSYTDKVNEMLKNIENKEPFSYDMNSDTLFQNALASAMNSGQLAMQDTMGQAAALTGGYGSTYSQAVGNQAYNQEIQGAYDQLPEFYQLARDTYDKDLQQLYDKLDMYNTADAIEYERLANAYGANADAAARLYDQEYNNYWQTQDFNEDSRRWAAEMGYKERQAKQSQDNWEQEYLLEALKSGNADAGSQYSVKLDDKLYQTALGLYNKWGADKGSKFRTWLDDLDISDEDATLLLDYVLGKGDSLSLTENGNSWWAGKSDNTYTDQWGREYTKQELLDQGYSEEQIKRMKKK